MDNDLLFVRAILADPSDVTLRLVYADWLEERGDRRAEYLRLEAALAAEQHTASGQELRQQLNELRKVIDRRWQALLDRTPLENCDSRFRSRCPKQWEKLKLTADDTTRACDRCQENVYYCDSVDAARSHAWQGHRVAVNSHVPRRPGDLDAGPNALSAINRTVREYEFIPVDGASLGQPMRGYLQRLTPPLLELGFQPIGDFRMKPPPAVVHDRILLSPDGRTLAAICCVLQSGAISFMSVLKDATGVHTSGSHNPRPERTFQPADQLMLNYHSGAPPAELHREHQQVLKRLGARTNGQAIAFRRDQFREIMVYDQCLFNRWRYRHGSLDHEPPAPDFNKLLQPSLTDSKDS